MCIPARITPFQSCLGEIWFQGLPSYLWLVEQDSGLEFVTTVCSPSVFQTSAVWHWPARSLCLIFERILKWRSAEKMNIPFGFSAICFRRLSFDPTALRRDRNEISKRQQTVEDTSTSFQTARYRNTAVLPTFLSLYVIVVQIKINLQQITFLANAIAKAEWE